MANESGPSRPLSPFCSSSAIGPLRRRLVNHLKPQPLEHGISLGSPVEVLSISARYPAQNQLRRIEFARMPQGVLVIPLIEPIVVAVRRRVFAVESSQCGKDRILANRL